MKKKVQTAGRIWSEVKSDHTDEVTGVSAIDAYLTEDPNEGGNVIATVDIDGVVTYNDDHAKAARTDEYAQEIIQKVVREKLAEKEKLVSQVIKMIIFECDGVKFFDSTPLELLLMTTKTEDLKAYLPEAK